MSETPKCIHNGAPCCRCMPNGPCAATGPTEKTPVEAFSAALHRAEISGDTSDGYHTFNELYDHRAKLFSVIVRNYPELCWKAKKHHDGTMYDGMFIVGINTAEGQASYHYDIDPYWPIFDCQELDRAPEWDGHTPQQAIDRIANLGKVEPENRPLTLEEIEKHFDKELDAEPLWIEFHYDTLSSRWLPSVPNPNVFGEFTIEYFVRKYGHRYGEYFRCWPRKPTPEQMAAEKWEE